MQPATSPAAQGTVPSSDGRVRDLLAMTMLPAVWLGAEPLRVAESLLAAIDVTICPAFCYVCLKVTDLERPVELAHRAGKTASPRLLEQLAPDLHEWIRDSEPGEVLALGATALGDSLRVCAYPIGFDHEHGVIVAGFVGPSSPSAFERTLLNVAANQAYVSCQTTKLQRQTSQLHEAALGEIAERQKAERALRHSEQFSRTLIESSSDCIKTLTLQGVLKWISHSGAESLCVPSVEEVIGRSWIDFWEGDDRIAARASVERAAAGETAQFVGMFPVRGVPRWWSVVVSPIRGKSGEVEQLLAVSRDVTDRKQREANLTFLSQIDLELARLGSASEIMDLVGAKIGEYLSLAGCNFCRVDEAADRLTTDFGWSNAEVPNLVRSYRLTEYFSEEFVRTAHAGETILIRNTQTDPRVDANAYAGLRIGSFVMVPFHRDGHWTDLFGAVDSAPRDWQHDEVELLQELATRIFPRLERARAEEALRESEERFRAALGAVGVLWTNNAEGRMEGEQPGWQSLTGQTEAEYEGYGWTAALHPDDVEPTLQAWTTAVSHRRPFVFEHRVRTRNGQWRHFSVHAVPVLTSDGAVREWVGLHFDISEAKEYEGALRENLAQYRQIAEGLPQMVWSAGADGVRDYFNVRWLEFTGIGLENDATPWMAVMHPNDRKAASEAWALSVRTGVTFQAEYRLRNRDGRFFWFLGRAIALRNEAGDVIRWFGTCTDIEQQKASQALLQITNDFAASLAADLDLDRIVQSLTDASTSAIGADFGAFFFKAADKEGESFLVSTLSGASREAFEKLGPPRATPLLSPTFRGEGIVRSADITKDPRYGAIPPHHGMPKGHPPVVSYLAVPVVSRSGEVVGGLFFGHSRAGAFSPDHERIVSSFAAQAALAIDNARLYERVKAMNDELEAKVQFRTSELLAAVERLKGFTYHVSHDLRAPLRAIASNCRILQQDFGSELSSQAQQYLDRQAKAATKLGRLVDDLLVLSRLPRQEMVRERIDVTALTRDAFSEALSIHPYSQTKLEVAEGLVVEADPHLFRLAFLNILENAVKYSPAGGTIRVGRKPDGTFFVRDQGIGMEPQYLSKIFEPFQRLHRDDEYSGTGIGLANVKQVVERHGGNVWAESQPGEGSTILFTVR